MKIKSKLIGVGVVVVLFVVLITSSLASSPKQVSVFQSAATGEPEPQPDWIERHAAIIQAAVIGESEPATLPPNMETALVPCGDGVTGPCDLIATKAGDIVGVWKQYLLAPFFNAPGGMAFIRFNADGTFNLADSIENSAKPDTSYASGTFTFDGQVVTYGAVVGAPPPCDTPPKYQLRVLKYGDKPVALRYVAISDPCVGRLQDVSQALVWVAPAQ